MLPFDFAFNGISDTYKRTPFLVGQAIVGIVDPSQAVQERVVWWAQNNTGGFDAQDPALGVGWCQKVVVGTVIQFVARTNQTQLLPGRKYAHGLCVGRHLEIPLKVRRKYHVTDRVHMTEQVAKLCRKGPPHSEVVW